MHTRLAKILLGLKESLDKLLTLVPINISGRFQGQQAMGPFSVLLTFPAQHRRAHPLRVHSFRKSQARVAHLSAAVSVESMAPMGPKGNDGFPNVFLNNRILMAFRKVIIWVYKLDCDL